MTVFGVDGVWADEKGTIPAGTVVAGGGEGYGDEQPPVDVDGDVRRAAVAGGKSRGAWSCRAELVVVVRRARASGRP